MNKHEKLVATAKEAIDEVSSNMSASQHETIDALNDIIGHCEIARDAIEQDIENAAREAGAADVGGDAGEGSET